MRRGLLLLLVLLVGTPIFGRAQLNDDWQELKGMFELVKGWATLWDFFAKLQPWAGSLYLGGVILGVLLAPAGYALSYLLWDVLLTLTHRRVKDEDGEPGGDA